jgi:pimeloyl-ACP methyl ester carboxylesterase
MPRARRFPYGYKTWHADANINYQLNRFLGGEPVSEVAALAARIATLADWKRELLAVAERTRSATYFRAAEFFMTPGDPDRERAYDEFVRLFWAEHAGDRCERVRVPYERGHTLPAIYLPAAQPAGTIVMHAGFDAFIEEFYAGGEALRDAGFDVILYDGPGQGEPLVKQHLAMTHAWERSVAAVLDHFQRADVTLVGISLGGYLAPRAAAFEPRVARVVAFDVMYDFFDASTSHAGGLLHAIGRPLVASALGGKLVDAAVWRLAARDLAIDWGVRQGMHVTGTASPSAFLRAIRDYTLAPVSERIACDVLVMAGSEDHHVPLAQLPRQIEALTAARSVTARVFTRAEEAASHCQIGNLDLAFDVIAAWTHERIASRAPA